MSDRLSSTARIGVLTVSDRASQGAYVDRGGPAVRQYLEEVIASPWEAMSEIVPDELTALTAALKRMADQDGCCLVITTGGTGPAPRDVTPEAMDEVLQKELPGFGEEMRRASLAVGVPTAILSRQTAGIVGQSLVVNLPGKPASVRVCLDAVFPAIPYCIDLAGGPYLEGNPSVIKVFRPQNR